MNESCSATIDGLIAEFLEACQVAMIYIDAGVWTEQPISPRTGHLQNTLTEYRRKYTIYLDCKHDGLMNVANASTPVFLLRTDS